MQDLWTSFMKYSRNWSETNRMEMESVLSNASDTTILELPTTLSTMIQVILRIKKMFF